MSGHDPSWIFVVIVGGAMFLAAAATVIGAIYSLVTTILSLF